MNIIAKLAVGTAVAAAAVVALTGGSAGAQTVHNTASNYIYPVHHNGTPAQGYRVIDSTSTTIDCTSDGPSPSAVDDNIRSCSPSAAAAQTCWRSTIHTALCLPNPFGHSLVRYRLSAPFQPVKANKHRVPAGVRLQVDDRCVLRDGGAWASADGHPDWVGTYYCDKGLLYGPSRNAGLDQSTNPWIAHVLSGQPGAQHVHDARVGIAVYVGTAS